MPYSYIEENKLLEQESVFPKKGGLAGNSHERNSQTSINSAASVSIDDEEGKIEKQDKVDDFLFSSPFTKSTFMRRKRQNEQPQHRYLTIYSMDYVYRLKVKAIFEPNQPFYVFDFFKLDDLKFDEFFIFENIWRESLLLNKFYQDHLYATAQA